MKNMSLLLGVQIISSLAIVVGLSGCGKTDSNSSSNPASPSTPVPTVTERAANLAVPSKCALPESFRPKAGALIDLDQFLSLGKGGVQGWKVSELEVFFVGKLWIAKESRAVYGSKQLFVYPKKEDPSKFEIVAGCKDDGEVTSSPSVSVPNEFSAPNGIISSKVAMRSGSLLGIPLTPTVSLVTLPPGNRESIRNSGKVDGKEEGSSTETRFYEFSPTEREMQMVIWKIEGNNETFLLLRARYIPAN